MFLNAYSKGNNRGIDISTDDGMPFYLYHEWAMILGGVVRITEDNL